MCEILTVSYNVCSGNQIPGSRNMVCLFMWSYRDNILRSRVRADKLSFLELL